MSQDIQVQVFATKDVKQLSDAVAQKIVLEIANHPAHRAGKRRCNRGSAAVLRDEHGNAADATMYWAFTRRGFKMFVFLTTDVSKHEATWRKIQINKQFPMERS